MEAPLGLSCPKATEISTARDSGRMPVPLAKVSQSGRTTVRIAVGSVHDFGTGRRRDTASWARVAEARPAGAADCPDAGLVAGTTHGLGDERPGVSDAAVALRRCSAELAHIGRCRGPRAAIFSERDAAGHSIWRRGGGCGAVPTRTFEGRARGRGDDVRPVHWRFECG